MQERVHLVHGWFSVESQTGKGTKILAVMPFAVENGSSAEVESVKETASFTGMA